MVAKADDEIYVLSNIKIYRCFSFVFLCCAKEGRVVQNTERDLATLKILYHYAKIVDKKISLLSDLNRVYFRHLLHEASSYCLFLFCFSISTLLKLQICVLFRGI